MDESHALGRDRAGGRVQFRTGPFRRIGARHHPAPRLSSQFVEQDDGNGLALDAPLDHVLMPTPQRRIDEPALERERGIGRDARELMFEIVYAALAIRLSLRLALEPTYSLKSALLGVVDLHLKAEGA